MAGAETTTTLYQGWVWAPRIDPNCGEYGLFVNQDNHLQINQSSEVIAITGMRVILNNTFAPMPICGHGYASAQFIGRGSTEFSMQLSNIGDWQISEIQSMHEKLESNARLFRRFDGAARVRFQGNEFLRLAGIDDGIITSVDTSTSPDGTNLYQCQISFTSDGHHTESFAQEMYVESDVAGDVLEVLLNRVNVRVISPEDTTSLEGDTNLRTRISSYISGLHSIAGSAVAGPAVAGAIGNVVGAGVAWSLSAIRNSLRDIGYNRAASLTSVEGMLELARIETTRGLQILSDVRVGGLERVEEQDARGAYMRFPVQTPIPLDQDNSAVYTPNSEPDHPWVLTYVQQVCDLFHQWMPNMPGQVFFRGNERGKYVSYRNGAPASENENDGVRTEWATVPGEIANWPPMLGNASSTLSGMIHGRRQNWRYLRSSSVTDLNGIETNIFEFEQQLMSIAQNILAEAQGEEGFDEVFSGITDRYINAPRISAHPTYPDLELPPHPATGLVIDTEPDYYFFNDGEEGMLNEVGPELAIEMDFRITNMEKSFERLSSGQEWSETYLGRNRVAVPDYDESRASLDDRYTYRGMDGSTGLTIDNSTDSEDVSWGHPGEGGRQIGGTDNESVIEAALNLSPTVLSSNSSGAEAQSLRNRRLGMMRNTSFSLPDPSASSQDRIGIGPIDSTLGRSNRSHSFAREAIQNVVKESVVASPEETLTMRRAFPSFKIYFIEDDTGAMRHLLPSGGSSAAVRPIMFFDDLYNYNSVKSIRLIRSRKNPSDLLILQLTNVQGLLERRRWTSPNERQRELYAPGFEETEMENPLKKIIMKEGLKVQARLGNTNNPLKMGIKFIGEVVEYSFNSDVADEVTIICQSFGAELTLERKGLTEETQIAFADTPDLIHTLMCSPELVHFGRFDLNPQFNPGEARNAATSRNDASTGVESGTGRLIGNPRVIIQRIQENLVINRSKWLLANNPSDDNIFAPGIRDDMTDWDRFTQDVGSSSMWGAEWVKGLRDGLDSTALHITTLGFSLGITQALGWVASGLRSLGEWLNQSEVVLSGQTIWEALKECELRHPGWIAQPRPYGTRSTMFFGVPSHNYWADEITRNEMVILQRLRAASEADWRNSAEGRNAAAHRAVAAQGMHGHYSLGLNELAALSGNARYVYLRTCQQMAQNRWLQEVGPRIGATLGRFRPFRRYHLITSDHHLLMNNIRASKKGTFNAVSLQYGDGQVYTLKADDDIPDELTKVQGFNYPSCRDETMARRYCIGLLNRHLKDVYKGEIVITGMDVDPYDLCFLNDDRLGMYGSFEIEQVVDTITAETGWITEITPDMITGTNEWSTRSTAEARTAVLGALSHRYMGARLDQAGASLVAAGATAAAGAILPAAGAVVGAGAILAWLGGYYVVRWTQDRQPLWVCPLILNDRPFFAGLDGFRQDGLFASVRGQLNASFDAVDEGWRKFHLAGYANDMTIAISRTLAGQGSL